MSTQISHDSSVACNLCIQFGISTNAKVCAFVFIDKVPLDGKQERHIIAVIPKLLAGSGSRPGASRQCAEHGVKASGVFPAPEILSLVISLLLLNNIIKPTRCELSGSQLLSESSCLERCYLAVEIGKGSTRLLLEFSSRTDTAEEISGWSVPLRAKRQEDGESAQEFASP